MSKKNKMNELRQVKDVTYTRDSSDSKKYKYVGSSYAKIGEKVIELRKRYPNNIEFGNEFDKLIRDEFNPPTFPGVQNL